MSRLLVEFEHSDGRRVGKPASAVKNWQQVKREWRVFRADGAHAIHHRIDYPGKAKPHNKRLWWEPRGIKANELLYGIELLDGQRVGVIVEGEPCADAVREVVPADWSVVGMVSSDTDPALISKLKTIPEWIIWPDNDDAGREKANKLCQHLADACSVRQIEWAQAPPTGDAVDYLREHSPGEALALITAAKRVSAKPILRLRTADEAKPEAVEWWWQDHIPVGKFGLLDGDPGLGKSVILCNLIASATAGRPLPDGSRPLKLGGVVLFAAEDGYTDTIVPRLIAAGADLSKVLVAHAADYGNPIRLPRDLNALEAFRSHVGALFLAFDPWEFYLDADIIKGKEQREKFEPVKKYIAERRVVLIGTRHLNQQSGQKAVYRGRGDITAIGMARYGFLVGYDPSAETERQEIDKVMVPLKFNLAPRSRVHGVRYSVEEVALESRDGQGERILAARVKWNGRTAVTADRAVEGSGRAQPLTARQVMEYEVLPLLRQNGPMKADDCWAIMREHGINGQGNVDAARKELGIKSAKEGMSGPWWWYLDGQQDRLPWRPNVTFEPKVRIDPSGRRIRTMNIGTARVVDSNEHS